MQLNPQAEELNEMIRKNSGTVYSLLSEKGKAIFFPAKGILAQSADAKGMRINATIGAAIEDDGSPMRLKSIAKEVNLQPGLIFPYAPSFGRPDLRKKWKEMIFEKNPGLKGKEVSLPIVTNAITHGLSVLGYMFLDEGDKVITPDLFWGNYKLIFINGYKVKLDSFETFKQGGFNTKGLKEKIGEGKGKKVVLLNFPNNPTGYTPTVEEVKEIVSIIKEAADKGNKILVICDDAYFGLVYEKGIEKESIFRYLADIHENVLAVKADGCTKEDYVWGFRVGFLTYAIKDGNSELYSALESKTSGTVRGNISNVNNLGQSLVYNAFSSPAYWDEKKEKYKLLKSRYDEVREVLEDKKYMEFFKALPFNSGYFMCIKMQEGIDAEEVRQILLKKYDTGIIAIPPLIRIAFSSCAKENIKKLFENIYDACKDVT
ncbi:aminotransferase class I/II-fold pyridoxal phosphate-dependent enzyme [Candidatus Woesearchaeota archaeon]|nr:aminotransferase class I/II-fold pyridoxal phosphate-dependent enzyme [Candidatus Woesearchaeota archaeon]